MNRSQGKTPVLSLEEAVYQARILIVDDQPPNVLLLERLLADAGYTEVASTTDSARALPLCATYDPDLLLLDLQMPDPDGFEIMRQLDARTSGTDKLPVLILTADSTSATKRAALAAGASDFLNKPFDATEAILRIRNLLLTRLLQRELRNQNATLERRVRLRTRQLEEARLEILERLALAAEYRDHHTSDHTRRVGRTAALIARELGLPEELVEQLERAATLHDVGKLGISDTILLKPGKLTPAEYEAMKHHAEIGAEILGHGNSRLLKLSAEIALTHHEHWDGNGYPNGLKGEEIPISGRIVAIADVYDALTQSRPYKDAWAPDRALEEIQQLSGRHFDPTVVDALTGLAHQLVPAMDNPSDRVAHQRVAL
jgi:putative two-component system response regulator